MKRGQERASGGWLRSWLVVLALGVVTEISLLVAFTLLDEPGDHFRVLDLVYFAVPAVLVVASGAVLIGFLARALRDDERSSAVRR
jgi:peptidoglycan/LPS O-acetylase OafA/YrhL